MTWFHLGSEGVVHGTIVQRRWPMTFAGSEGVAHNDLIRGFGPWLYELRGGCAYGLRGLGPWPG